MKIKYSIIVFVYTVVLPVMQTFAQSTMKSFTALQSEINHFLKRSEGEYAIAFKNLAKPKEYIVINEKETFHAASTMKTPVMIEVFKQVRAGQFKLTDSIQIKNEFRSIVDGSTYSLAITDDSGEQLYQKIGQKMAIRDLIYEMITLSSNLATNVLIELVEAKKVNQTMHSLGAADIQVVRGVEDIKAFQKGLNNTITAYDLMVIYEKMALEEIVDKAACHDMIKILTDQKFNEIIPAKLPKNVKVAHKTGDITGVRHDSGIVYLPDGRKYVLILLSKNLKDTEAGIQTLAAISEMIYQYMIQ